MEIEFDSDLTAAIREKWIRTVIQHWSGDKPVIKRILVGICRRLDAIQTLDLLRETIMHEATTQQGALIAIDGVEEIAGEEVLQMLWECAGAKSAKAEATRRLVVFLCKYAWDWLRTRLDLVVNTGSLGTEQRVIILATVFGARAVDSWDIIWPALHTDSELARPIFGRLAFRHQYGDESRLRELSESQIVELYRKLAELYPIAEDPSLYKETHPDEQQAPGELARQRIAEFRANIPALLAVRDSQAGCDALELLASEFEAARVQILWYHRQSTERWRMKTWIRPKPSDVTQLLLDPNTHLVKSSEDLVDVVIESLRRLQSRIRDSANPLLYDFWFLGRIGNTDRNLGPQYEEHVARRIAAWLQDDLQNRYAVVINREVVPRWHQRTDITVEAPIKLGTETVVPKVIIELKGNWHQEVRTACGTQLVDSYLHNQVSAAGIYLVAWFGPGQLPGEDNPRTNRLLSQEFSSASTEVEGLVADQRATFAVEGFVLDCTLD